MQKKQLLETLSCRGGTQEPHWKPRADVQRRRAPSKAIRFLAGAEASRAALT